MRASVKQMTQASSGINNSVLGYTALYALAKYIIMYINILLLY